MENTQLQVIDDKQLVNYLNKFGYEKLPKEQKEQFIEIAKAFGLNPFKREIHLVAYGSQFSIIIGYEAFIKRAEKTGLLAGWKAETDGSVETSDLTATVTIHRKDWTIPFEHSVKYEEFVQMKTDKETNKRVPNENWSKRPEFMLKKVAIGQAFRMCFSTELGGMPYTEEEAEIISIETVQNKESKMSELQLSAMEMLENNIIELNMKPDHYEKVKNGIMESEKKAQDAIDWITKKMQKNEAV